MKNLSFVFGHTSTPTHTNANNISLHTLVDNLMDSFLPLAVAKHSFIINDIDSAFKVEGDEQVLAYIIGNMMMNAISHSKFACVRLDVIRKYNGIQVRIRNNGACYYSSVFNSIGQIAA